MGFSIQDYMAKNTINLGTVKKAVGNNDFKSGYNDLRKTNYDVKLTEDGKLDLYTHKEEKKNINLDNRSNYGRIRWSKPNQANATSTR